MPKHSCQRKGCARIRSELAIFLSRRRAPNFEGHPFCSDSCLLTFLENELTARWQRLEHEQVRAIPRPKLGTILLQNASITRAQLDNAVALQKETQHGRLGEWLQRLGYLEERQITMALSRQYGIPCINLKNPGPKSDAAKMIPGQVARSLNLVPVGYDDNGASLRLAVRPPLDFGSHEAIRRMLQTGIRSYIGDDSAIDDLLERWYGSEEVDFSKAQTFRTLEELLEISNKIVKSASNHRAENIQAELLEDFLWVRVDFADHSEHRLYRHGSKVGQNHVPIGATVTSASSVGSYLQ